MFVGVLALILCAVPVLDLINGGMPVMLEWFRHLPALPSMSAFQKEVETNNYTAGKLRPWMQFWRFVILRDVGDKALVNGSNWFFYKPAFRYMTESWPNANSPDNNIAAAIISYRDELRQRGIHMLVLIAPNKSSIYPEMLAERCSARRLMNESTQEVIRKLNESGVHYVDLFEVYAQAKCTASNNLCYYSSQDSHWSPEGIWVAAKATADKLLELGWIEKGGVSYSLREFVFERHGDIVKMMQVPQIERAITPERIECLQVFQTLNGQSYNDDANSPLLIIGDSFLRVYQDDEPKSAGFIAALAYELQLPITSLVYDGGASTLVRQRLYTKPVLLKNKKVLIWEFVERDIRFGTEGWQLVSLPPEDTAGPEP